MRWYASVALMVSSIVVAGLVGCGSSNSGDYKVPPGGDGTPDAPTGSNPVDARAIDAPPSSIDAALVGADLAITISASPTPVDLSSTLTYRLDITNHGDREAADVVVTQNLPAGNVAFLSATGIDWTCTHVGQQVVCKRATLHLGAAPFIEVKVTTPPNSGSLVTTVNVSAATNDPVMTNNDAVDATMVLAPDLATADLSVVIADTPDPVTGTRSEGCGPNNAGCTSYTIDVSNAGPDVATQLQVTITLPGQGQFNNCVGEGWVCPAPQNGKLVATLPTLAIGPAKPLLLNWKAPSPGGFSILVDVTVAGSSTDNNPTNDAAREDTTVNP